MKVSGKNNDKRIEVYSIHHKSKYITRHRHMESKKQAYIVKEGESEGGRKKGRKPKREEWREERFSKGKYILHVN